MAFAIHCGLAQDNCLKNDASIFGHLNVVKLSQFYLSDLQAFAQSTPVGSNCNQAGPIHQTLIGFACDVRLKFIQMGKIHRTVLEGQGT